jgi:hypothetical protein
MNLETRISKLEDKAGITDEIPPLVVITVKDCSRVSQDPGTPQMAIVPARQIGSHGISLTRREGEDPDTFLKRCEKKHSEFYI